MILPTQKGEDPENDYEQFVLAKFDELIEANEKQVDSFVAEFKKIKKANSIIKNLTTIPGIQERSAVKLLAVVIDPQRFSDKGKWLSYCGLVAHEKMSGGRSYGKRSPQYSREAKSVFKIAAMACIHLCKEDSPFHRYFDLLRSKGIAEHNARHAVARRIAVVALGIMKSNKPFEDRWEVKTTKKQ